MSSQSGEFSCVEISWEESSTKSKNVYGVVEEPRDERIIPIRIDRGISIHTASDEEEEPFWVVESVKKHEEVKNEIKKMKEEKILRQSSQVNNDDEEDDNSMKELLERVQKQRNDLEDILERKNNYTEKTISRSNSILSEASTIKERSVSRLSSLEENIKISESSNIHIKNKKEFSSITENTSEEFNVNIFDNLDRPKTGSLTRNSSIDSTKNNTSLQNENLNRKYPKREDSISNTVKRVSLSRLSSKEECDNSFSSQKIKNEYSEIPISESQKSKVSRPNESDNASMPTNKNEDSDRSYRASLPIEHSKQDDTSETCISSDQHKSNSDVDKYNSVSKLPLQDTSEAYEKKPSKIKDKINDTLKTISVENLNGSNNSLNFMKNDGLKSDIEATKITDNDNYELNALQKAKADEADYRRKSLIRQSSMLSDALNAMCSEKPEDSNYTKQKRLSIKEDSIKNNLNSNLKEKNENDLSKPSIQKAISTKPPSIDEDESQGYFGRKSSISVISNDKNIKYIENAENKFTKESAALGTNDIPVKEKSDNSKIGVSSRSPIVLDNNQNTFSEIENQECSIINNETNPTKGTLENDLNNLHLYTNSPLYNDKNTIPDSGILNDSDLHSTPKLLLKDNNLDISPIESIVVKDDNNKSEIIVKDLNPDNLTDSSLLLEKDKCINNQTIPLKKHLIDKENSLKNTESNIKNTNVVMSTQPTSDTKNQTNEKILKINEEIHDKSTYGIKQGIQNIRCNNNVSVVFYFLFVQKSSLFRLLKLHIVYIVIIRLITALF